MKNVNNSFVNPETIILDIKKSFLDNKCHQKEDKHNFQEFSSIIDYVISSNITNTNYLDKLYYSTVKKHYKLAKNFKKISQDDQLI